MSEAARVGDPIAHTSALTGLLTGLAVCATAALIGVTVVGTGGLAAVAVVGAAAAGGAGIGEVIGSLSLCTSNTGNITTGSPDVYINGRPAVRATLSVALCAKHVPPPLVAEGSSSVYINGMPASRVGDHTTCGAKINAGSSNVFIGGQTVQTEEIDAEVPGWLHMAVLGLGLVSVTGLVRYGVIGVGRLGLGMAGGAGGGFGGHWAGGKVFGEGSDGQKVTALVSGAVIGGLTAWRGGIWWQRGKTWLNAHRQIKKESLTHISGVNLSKSQSRMLSDFNKAGYPTKPVISPTSGKQVGTQYTLPDGTRVRVMQADGRNPMRASFENANGGPIDPTTGKPPQPPPGLTAAQRKQWARQKTHLEQVK